MNVPLVVAVCGLPATGKTTLSRQLGAALDLPVWSKDALKEQLWDALGTGTATKQPLGRASVALLFHALETELEAGRGCIVESTFRPAWDTLVFRVLEQKYPCRLVSVYCTCDESVRDRRFRERVWRGERHPCHPDGEIIAQNGDTAFSTSGVDAIGPLVFNAAPLMVDTTTFDTIDVQALCAAIADR